MVLDYPDIHFVARWPYLTGHIPDSKEHAKHFWEDDLSDLSRADIILVYAEPEDKLRGTLVEVGAGIARGKSIFCVGEHEDYGTWQHHSKVTACKSLVYAIGLIKSFSL